MLVHWILTGEYLHTPAADLNVIGSTPPRLSTLLPDDWTEFVSAAVAPTEARPHALGLAAHVPPLRSEFSPERVLRGDDLNVVFSDEAVVGRTLYKLSPTGHHHRVRLQPGGTLTESPMFDPLAVWNGGWCGRSVNVAIGDHRMSR